MAVDVTNSGAKTPHLDQLAAFEEALHNYHISDHAKEVLRQVSLVLLVGPSSSGRNTIILRLQATGAYHFIVSDTTRPPRSNNGVMEQNGREYWFRSEQEVLDDIRSGEFLEAEIIHQQQVSGVSIRELTNSLDEHKIAITDVDIGGINQIIEAKPDAVALAILPPSFEEWQRRLTDRGAMDVAQLRRRLETAARIFAAAHEDSRFTLIINDNLEHAVKQVHQAVEQHVVDPALQAEARALALRLRDETLAYLKQLQD